MAIDISGRMDHGANSSEIIGFSVSRELCAECARRARYARHWTFRCRTGRPRLPRVLIDGSERIATSHGTRAVH